MKQLILILVWIVSILGAVLGTFILFGGMSSARSAPQQTVVCALALAVTVLPYCLARAVTEIIKSKE